MTHLLRPPPVTWPPPPPLSFTIEGAHAWLKHTRAEALGLMSKWSPHATENHHRDLGLLVDFITDVQARTGPPEIVNRKS